MTKVSALARARTIAAAQQETARLLRTAIAECRNEGATWREIGEAVGMPNQVVLRQYRDGGPIVAVSIRRPR
jgi:hypothetical protein